MNQSQSQRWYKSRDNATQTLDLTGPGLTYDYKLQESTDGKVGPLHPTDLDAVFQLSEQEGRNRRSGLVVSEFKCRGVSMTRGQRETIARMAKGERLLGGYGWGLEVRHYVYNASEDIDASAQVIWSYTDGGEWRRPWREGLTLGEFMRRFVRSCKDGIDYVTPWLTGHAAEAHGDSLTFTA